MKWQYFTILSSVPPKHTFSPSHICFEKNSFSQNRRLVFENYGILSFGLERDPLCGHYAGPENFIRLLSSENGPKQDFQCRHVYFPSFLSLEGREEVKCGYCVIENLVLDRSPSSEVGCFFPDQQNERRGELFHAKTKRTPYFQNPTFHFGKNHDFQSNMKKVKNKDLRENERKMEKLRV